MNQSIVRWMLLAFCMGWTGCGSTPDTSDADMTMSGDAEVSMSDASVDSGVIDAGESCRRNADCDDGNPCNGEEQCIPGSAGADPRGCVAGSAPCSDGQECVADGSSFTCRDHDCSDPDVDGDGDDAIACGGGDCDDNDPLRASTLGEICNVGVAGSTTRDEDCNPSTIHSEIANDGNSDRDDQIASYCMNLRADGTENRGLDCDDSRATVYFGADEVCNMLDDDCDMRNDEGVTSSWYVDCDGDSIGAGAATESCSPPAIDRTMCTAPLASYVLLRGDCDDTDSAINPDETDICNGINDDCDSSTDEAGVAYCEAITPRPANTESFRCNEMVDADGQYCGVDVCTMGYGNCDNLHATGCETDLTGDEANCGACGVVCTAGQHCLEGACVQPVQVETSNGGVESISHTCARLSTGNVQCWGDNGNYQLGAPSTGTCTDSTFGFSSSCSTRPLLVSGISTATDIALGGAHTCARLSSGQVSCWGSNGSGQLGDGTTTSVMTPTIVTGISNADSVAAGSEHTCAVLSSGTVSCWGRNNNGQLGNNTRTDSITPVAVLGITTAVEVTAGAVHTCARLSTGEVRCWGANFSGQLGNGTLERQLVPTLVAGISNADEVSTGAFHTCVRSNCAVTCWGDNALGAVGDGTVANRLTPVEVLSVVCGDGGSGAIIDIASGGAHSCAITRNSGGIVSTSCWGMNADGQLGYGSSETCATGSGTYACTTAPMVLSGVLGSSLAAGAGHTCTLYGGGQATCWGANAWGELGDGTTLNRSSPVTVNFR